MQKAKTIAATVVARCRKKISAVFLDSQVEVYVTKSVSRGRCRGYAILQRTN